MRYPAYKKDIKVIYNLGNLGSPIMDSVMAAFSAPLFQYNVIGTQLHAGVVRTKSSTDKVFVDWGDGSAQQEFAGTSDQAYSKGYDSSGNRTVRIFGSDQTVLTRWTMTTAGANVGGRLVIPSGMTYFLCIGSNTFSGALSIPSGMTYFSCSGNNTLSGALSIPSGMTSFLCSGNNTLSDWSWPVIANNQSRFNFVPVGAGGFTSARVDALLMLLDTAGGTWATPKEIRLTGTCQPRTSASDQAVASLVAKGVTVTTTL